MIAYLFPGQGSQTVGMAMFLYDNFASAKLAVEEASDTLHMDMVELLFEDPKNELHLTANTQPALLTSSTAYYRALKEVYDIPARISAGHSLGEYSAFVANEVISYADALKLTRERGLAMQKAVPVGKGAMLAVMGAEEKDLLQALADINGVIEVANYNSPGQLVVSGESAAVERLKNYDTQSKFGKKWKMIPLKVSAPFHCSLMQKAEEHMQTLLTSTDMQSPQAPVVQNFTAKESIDPEELRSNLIRQITGSVRWTASIQRMQELGVTKVLEVGPGKVLSSLVKKIDSNGIQSFNIQNLDDFKNLEQRLDFHER